MHREIDESGFTLIELLIVVAIITILVAVAIPVFTGQLNNARVVADRANIGVLNSVSRVYGMSYSTTIGGDIFEGISTDSARMSALISEGYLDESPEVQQAKKKFAWSVANQAWYLEDTGIVLWEGSVTFRTGGHSKIIGSYTGTEASIVIPNSIGGTTVEGIYQDAFREKGLTGVSFSDDSALTRIHARAFWGNDLRSITLPDSLERIDYGAFKDNPNLNTVTIGANVTTIEGEAFNGGSSFSNLYFSAVGGAGTYVYANGMWTKQ